MTTPVATFIFILSVLVQPVLAGARQGVPINNIHGAALPSVGGRELTLVDVQAALSRVAAKRNWVLEGQMPGKTVGTLVVRGKHTIKVDITYTAKAMSIAYKDSVNMNYETYSAQRDNSTGSSVFSPGTSATSKIAEGQPLIHPNFNVWIGELLKQVRQEITEGTP